MEENKYQPIPDDQLTQRAESPPQPEVFGGATGTEEIPEEQLSSKQYESASKSPYTSNQMGLLGAGAAGTAAKTYQLGKATKDYLETKYAAHPGVQNYINSQFGVDFDMSAKELSRLSGMKVNDPKTAWEAIKKIRGSEGTPETVKEIYKVDPITKEQTLSHIEKTPGEPPSPRLYNPEDYVMTPVKRVAKHVGMPLRAGLAGYDIAKGYSEENPFIGGAEMGAGVATAAAPWLPGKLKTAATVAGTLPVVGSMIGSANAAPVTPSEAAGTAFDVGTSLIKGPLGLLMSPSELGAGTLHPKREVYRPGMEVLKGSRLEKYAIGGLIGDKYADGGSVNLPPTPRMSGQVPTNDAAAGMAFSGFNNEFKNLADYQNQFSDTVSANNQNPARPDPNVIDFLTKNPNLTFADYQAQQPTPATGTGGLTSLLGTTSTAATPTPTTSTPTSGPADYNNPDPGYQEYLKNIDGGINPDGSLRPALTVLKMPYSEWKQQNSSQSMPTPPVNYPISTMGDGTINRSVSGGAGFQPTPPINYPVSTMGDGTINRSVSGQVPTSPTPTPFANGPDIDVGMFDPTLTMTKTPSHGFMSPQIAAQMMRRSTTQPAPFVGRPNTGTVAQGITPPQLAAHFGQPSSLHAYMANANQYNLQRQQPQQQQAGIHYQTMTPVMPQNPTPTPVYNGQQNAPAYQSYAPAHRVLPGGNVVPRRIIPVAHLADGGQPDLNISAQTFPGMSGMPGVGYMQTPQSAMLRAKIEQELQDKTRLRAGATGMTMAIPGQQGVKMMPGNVEAGLNIPVGEGNIDVSGYRSINPVNMPAQRGGHMHGANIRYTLPFADGGHVKKK